MPGNRSDHHLLRRGCPPDGVLIALLQVGLDGYLERHGHRGRPPACILPLHAVLGGLD